MVWARRELEGFCSSAWCPVRALKFHPRVVRGLLIPPIGEMQEAAPALAPGHCGARQSTLSLWCLIPPWIAPGLVWGVIFNEGNEGEAWRILNLLSGWIYTKSQGKGDAR